MESVPEELSPRELEARLSAGEPVTVLDVREPWELEIARFPGAVHIPMNEVPARLGELDRSRETVVVCRSGARSLQVARFLAQAGFRSVANLAGGILAWSQDVDPTIRPY